MGKIAERLKNGIITENPTFVQMLGMCPTLAVTSSAINGLGMGLTTMVILTMSNFMISLLRKLIPDKVRIPAYIVIIASFVTIVQFVLQAYIPSLNDSLGIFIPLIVVNCIILGRAESYASKNPVIPSIFDGIGMGLGFTVGLTTIGIIREILGSGSIFGFSFVKAVENFAESHASDKVFQMENLLLALFVLIVILIFKHCTKGFLSSSSILLGIIAGYIAAIVMGFVLPTTGVTADGVEYTKAWVLNWDKVADAAWFAIPKIMPVKPVFDMRAILPVMIMFIVTAVETVGDISGVMEGGLGREATDKELSGGVMCDGLGSSLAACFGVLPNTSFSQNVGLVAMTKVVNRFALATGAVFLILCGLCPKLAALISIMPQSVLGGAAVMMFSSIVFSGIQLITKNPMNSRNLSIVSVALGVGYGMGANPDILVHAPKLVQLVFGGSGIVPAAIVAILLNIVLPKEKEEQ